MSDTLYGFPIPLGIISNEMAFIGLVAIGVFVIVALIVKRIYLNKICSSCFKRFKI